MHLYKVSSLKCLSEYRLSEVLFLLLQNNFFCRKSIEEYCEVLKSIGNFNLVSELTLDRLAESENCSDEVWNQAYNILIPIETQKLRIKHGWNCEVPLLQRLSKLSNLKSIDITGVGTNEILATIVSHCPQLKCIKASYSNGVTDIGLSNLCSNKKEISKTTYQQHSSEEADATKVIPSYEDVDADTGMRPGDTTICEDVRGECDRCDIVESHVACGHCCCKNTDRHTKVEFCTLRSLQLLGCSNVSVDSVLEVLDNQKCLTHVSHDKLPLIFQKIAEKSREQVYWLQNYEHNVFDDEDIETFIEKLAAVCPYIKTAKLNIIKDSDDILRFISKLTRINEVIIDYSGKLGPGFSCFLTQSGFKLTKLSLSLQKFSFLDMKLISQECNRLKIFHIFFTNYTNNSNNCAKHALQMNHLEVLYLGVGKNCDSDLVHTSLTSNILSFCPSIQSLYLSGVSQLFCDSFLCKLLKTHCLIYLETFIVKQNVS